MLLNVSISRSILLSSRALLRVTLRACWSRSWSALAVSVLSYVRSSFSTACCSAADLYTFFLNFAPICGSHESVCCRILKAFHHQVILIIIHVFVTLLSGFWTRYYRVNYVIIFKCLNCPYFSSLRDRVYNKWILTRFFNDCLRNYFPERSKCSDINELRNICGENHQKKLHKTSCQTFSQGTRPGFESSCVSPTLYIGPGRTENLSPCTPVAGCQDCIVLTLFVGREPVSRSRNSSISQKS